MWGHHELRVAAGSWNSQENRGTRLVAASPPALRTDTLGRPGSRTHGLERGMIENCPKTLTSPKACCLCRLSRRWSRRATIRARAPITPEQIQPSSIDLRLGHEAYRVRASFLANGDATITSKLEQYRLHTIDLTRPAVLEKGCVYIVPCRKSWPCPRIFRVRRTRRVPPGAWIFSRG